MQWSERASPPQQSRCGRGGSVGPGWLVLLLSWSLPALPTDLCGQETATAPAAQAAPAEGAGATPSSEATTASQSPAVAPASNGSSPSASATPAAPGAASAEGASTPTTIQRPAAPARVPDPREFDVRPDANARVQFSFHGQLWPDLLQWLASIQGLSLDWQELPNDHVHIATNRPLTLPETQDLFARLLFERGFTIIRQQGVLLIAKLDRLDPSLLRRIDDEAELLDLPAHEFVKTTFQLPEHLKADKAAEDVKSLLSKHAKVQPLMATNRLLVVDLVANLREVSQVLNAEQATAANQAMPKEFPIRYARATHVADQVMILLGLDPSSRRTPEELQVEQQRLQLFAQMQQQGKDVSKYLRSGESPQVFIAVNHRNNAIVANAPPKEMSIIERAVQFLDVPNGLLEGVPIAELSLKRYQLVSNSPQAVVSALQDIGDLDPRTQFKIDSDASVVFAHATATDHAKIQGMIDRLDGSGRQFEVIWLRRLPADSVALTIHQLMVGQDEKDDQQNNRRGYFFYGYEEPESPQKPGAKGFRVDADVENNRLLLWANEDELQEVRNFLVKLGELPGGNSTNPNTVRVLEPRSQAATERLLDELQRVWPSVHSAPLEVERPEPPTAAPVPDSGTDEASALPPRTPRQVATDDTLLALANTPLPVSSVAVSDTEPARPASSVALPSPDGQLPRRAAAPVRISVDASGRVVISSADTQALDQLEDLVRTLAGKPPQYEVFYLKHASASLVTLNLEEYFAEEKKSKSDTEENYWRGWYGFDMSNEKPASPGGLSQRRPIRFIYDFDTNSILVTHATPEQLELVRSLVNVYDKPLSEDALSARRFEMFQMRFAKAADVAKTIKEVYRDLLSAKDQVFDRNKDEKEQTSQATNIYRVYGGVGTGSGDADKKPTKIKTSFAGALSVGVDEVSNTVIISAQEEWMETIAQMVRFLDDEAAPYRPHVQVVNSKITPAALQAALNKVFGDQAPRVETGSADHQANTPSRSASEEPRQASPPVDPDDL